MGTFVVQRYATDADGNPQVEVTTWQDVPDDDPRGQKSGEQTIMWVACSNPLAPVEDLVTNATVDDVTGTVLDPGGQITDPDAYWALYDQPLRVGWKQITRKQYENLAGK